jgi:hypothetical protein
MSGSRIAERRAQQTDLVCQKTVAAIRQVQREE